MKNNKSTEHFNEFRRSVSYKSSVVDVPLLHSDCGLDFNGLHRAVLLEAYEAERRRGGTRNLPELFVLPLRLSTCRSIFRTIT
jgi:hypothetical protein